MFAIDKPFVVVVAAVAEPVVAQSDTLLMGLTAAKASACAAVGIVFEWLIVAAECGTAAGRARQRALVVVEIGAPTGRNAVEPFESKLSMWVGSFPAGAVW